MIPVHFDSDRRAIDEALATSGLRPPEQARVIRIRNTLRIRDLEVSEALQAELRGRADVVVDDEARELAFDADGNLDPPLLA
jgi:hypothetical protein